MRTKVLDFWAGRVWLDTLAAVGLGALCGWMVPITTVLDAAARTTLYGGAAALVGVLGALATVALNVYGSGAGQRLRRVRELDVRGDMRRNFTAAFVVPPISALACWVAQAVDLAKHPQPALGLCAVALALSIFTFARQTWLFRHLMRIADLDATDANARPAAPARNRARERLEPIKSRGPQERRPIAL